jgi:hypothetical protein
MILEAFEEHHIVDLVLAELPKVDPAAHSFVAKLTVLKELDRASNGSKTRCFSMAEKRLGDERIGELGAQLGFAPRALG